MKQLKLGAYALTFLLFTGLILPLQAEGEALKEKEISQGWGEAILQEIPQVRTI